MSLGSLAFPVCRSGVCRSGSHAFISRSPPTTVLPNSTAANLFRARGHHTPYLHQHFDSLWVSTVQVVKHPEHQPTMNHMHRIFPSMGFGLAYRPTCPALPPLRRLIVKLIRTILCKTLLRPTNVFFQRSSLSFGRCMATFILSPICGELTPLLLSLFYKTLRLLIY